MKIPHALDMQQLKYGDRPEAERDRMAEALLTDGRRSEALLLYEGRPDHAFVKEQARWACAEGDAFHLFAVRGMGGAVSDDDIRACAEAAERKGRFLDARRCHLALDDEAAVRRIAEHIPESLRPASETPSAEG